MNLKISFLIAAHNEEKIIAKTLENLLNLPYQNYEVIIGLDGCTDKTEETIKKFCKKSKKFKYFVLNLRQGKNVVINSIIKKASGEIIIINDADWIFRIKDKKTFKKFISVFNNPKIGGIAESFPVEWNKDKIKNGNFGYRIVAYSSYFWMEFQKKKFTEEKNGLLKLKIPTMFLTNLFRKKFYRENSSLGDDLERTYDIMKQGNEVVIFNDAEMPRMIAVYDKISVRKLFKQKIRTAIAREQVKTEQEINLRNYYFPAIVYILKNSFKKSFSCGLLMVYWISLTSIATFISKFNKKDAKEGWKLRARN